MCWRILRLCLFRLIIARLCSSLSLIVRIRKRNCYCLFLLRNRILREVNRLLRVINSRAKMLFRAKKNYCNWDNLSFRLKKLWANGIMNPKIIIVKIVRIRRRLGLFLLFWRFWVIRLWSLINFWSSVRRDLNGLISWISCLWDRKSTFWIIIGCFRMDFWMISVTDMMDIWTFSLRNKN